MTTVSVREFSHHMAKYIKEAHAGERIVVTQHNVPVVDIVPHAGLNYVPSWKQPIKRIKLKEGVSLSEMFVRDREQERS